MKTILHLLALAAVLSLASCASTKKEECCSADQKSCCSAPSGKGAKHVH